MQCDSFIYYDCTILTQPVCMSCFMSASPSYSIHLCMTVMLPANVFVLLADNSSNAPIDNGKNVNGRCRTKSTKYVNLHDMCCLNEALLFCKISISTTQSHMLGIS